MTECKCICWFILFSLSIPSAWADIDYGPAQSYVQSPLHTNSLSAQLRSGFSMQEEEVELYTSANIASIWAITPHYSLDYYQNQLAMGGKWQLTSKWQVEFNYRWNFAANNHLDGLTLAFHDWFGIDQNGREDVDNDRFIIQMPEYGIDQEAFRGETLSRALTSYLQYQLVDKSHHGLSLGVSLYYNDPHHGIFNLSEFEQAVQLNYGYRRGKHALDTLLAITFRNPTNVPGQTQYHSSTWSMGTSYRYQWLERHYLIGQVSFYQGLSTGEDDFSKPSTEFILGYRYQMSHSAIEVTVVENMFNANNSTDIAFGLGYRYRFGRFDKEPN